MNQRRIGILMAGLVACTGIGRGAEPGGRSSGEILLGMSTALSGPAASMGEEMRTGVLAALERANRAGGIRGQRLRLIALDDGYEPLRTVPNMRRLVEKDEVLAVIGNVGTPTARPNCCANTRLTWAVRSGSRAMAPARERFSPCSSLCNEKHIHHERPKNRERSPDSHRG
jgi:hypothetical protein